MRSDDAILSTMRVEDFPDPVPGSDVIRCDFCGGSCWLSSATRKHLEGIPFKAQCNRCRSPISVRLEEEKIEPPSPEQRREVLGEIVRRSLS